MALVENRELMYTLITDRDEAHVKRLKELFKIRWQDMTAAQRSEWLNGSEEPVIDANEEACYQENGEQVFFAARGQKGAYNGSDMNRVSNVLDYLEQRLRVYGFYPPELNLYFSWGSGILIPSVARQERYLQDIRSIKNVLPLPEDTPDVPATLDYFTTETANDIEKILWAVNEYLNLIDPSWVYSGEVFCGEV